MKVIVIRQFGTDSEAQEQGGRGSVITLMCKSGGIINSVVKWLFNKLCLDILLSPEKKKGIEEGKKGGRKEGRNASR